MARKLSFKDQFQSQHDSDITLATPPYSSLAFKRDKVCWRLVEQEKKLSSG